jgi:hypothetical protein
VQQACARGTVNEVFLWHQVCKRKGGWSVQQACAKGEMHEVFFVMPNEQEERWMECDTIRCF